MGGRRADAVAFNMIGYAQDFLKVRQERVSRGTLAEDKSGVRLLAVCLPQEGIVLMPMPEERRGR